MTEDRRAEVMQVHRVPPRGVLAVLQGAAAGTPKGALPPWEGSAD